MLDELLTNPIITVGFCCWLVAQTTKYLLALVARHPVHFSDSGGMPSSHAAVVGSTVVVAGLSAGLASDIFGLAVVLAAIVLHDAYRVRWSVGEQAERLNQLLAQAKTGNTAPVVVWRGHRIREVIVGLLLGVTLSWGLYGWWYG